MHYLANTGLYSNVELQASENLVKTKHKKGVCTYTWMVYIK